jgi:putative flavoprotein involved in K+ transport
MTGAPNSGERWHGCVMRTLRASHSLQVEMSTQRPRERFDVVVVGGGQAGLAMGYQLAKRNLSFVILDAHSRVGDAWRLRWDSLRLFTPARLDGLPEMPFPDRAGALPSKDEVADYLEAFASRFKLPIRLGTAVDFVATEADQFVLSSGDDRFEADQLVMATGGHPDPIRPGFARELDPDILQLHSSEYRNPSQLREGEVLVVGAGNSGAEIAMNAAANHRTWLAGRCTGTLPPLVYSRPLWWILTRLGTVNTTAGRKMRARAEAGGTPLVRLRPKDFAGAGIIRVPRVTSVQDGMPRLENGQQLHVKNVVWCTGFAHDYSWIRIPALGNGHIPPHERGVVRSIPGLYFVGLPFQFGLNSALIDGVGRDAEYIAQRIVASARARGELHEREGRRGFPDSMASGGVQTTGNNPGGNHTEPIKERVSRQNAAGIEEETP